MAYIDYDVSYSICGEYELSNYNLQRKKQIVLSNKVGTEYLNILNSYDEIEKLLLENAGKLINLLKHKLDNEEIEQEISKTVLMCANKLSKRGFFTLSSTIVFDIRNGLKNYISQRAFTEKEYNDIKLHISTIEKILKDNKEKSIKDYLKKYNAYYDKKMNISEQIKLLESELEQKINSLNLCMRIIDEENRNLEKTINNIYLNVLITIFNSINFYNNEEIQFPLRTNTFLNRSLEDLDRKIFYESNYLEIPRNQVNYEIVKDQILYIDEEYEKIHISKDKKIVTTYKIENTKDFCCVNIKYFIDNNIVIKKCKNCGKYFIPHNKQVYCDNPSPQNKNKTCRNLTDDLRSNKNPIYEVYRNNYKTQSNKKRRNLHIKTIEEKFNEWNKFAREEMEKCVRGEITLDEYKEWHKNNQDWIKKF